MNLGRLLKGVKSYSPPELAEKLEKNINLVLLHSAALEQEYKRGGSALDNAGSSTISQSSGTTTPAGSHSAISQQSSSSHQQLPAKELEKITNDCAKYLAQVKQVLIKPVDGATGHSEAQQHSSEYVYALIVEFTKRKSLLYNMIRALDIVQFESKKEISAIFGALVRRQLHAEVNQQTTSNIIVKHIAENDVILSKLIENYGSAKNDVALNSGAILRECIKNPDLAYIVLHQHHARFFEYANLASFDILSDAFSTFRDLMSRHKPLVKDFLTANYQSFFAQYNEELIRSDNYVTKRQSIKLISEVLLDRLNFQVMTKYVADVENLKVIMELLCDRSDAIKFEAFHVFKIFVANPNKSERVEKLLMKNKERLIEFLTAFQVEQRQEDEQFQEERQYLIKYIKTLQPRAQTANAGTAPPPQPSGKQPTGTSQTPQSSKQDQ